MYELPHELSNDLRLKILKIRKFEENPWNSWIWWRVNSGPPKKQTLPFAFCKTIHRNFSLKKAWNFIKKGLPHRCFPVNFADKDTFYKKHLRWLLPKFWPNSLIKWRFGRKTSIPMMLSTYICIETNQDLHDLDLMWLVPTWWEFHYVA